MFFSIIIPTYNPRDYLNTLLTSICENKCLDEIEVIVSDDCSTENFDDILAQYDKLTIRTIVNDRHYGFPRTGRQNGADQAKGDWIYFADQDDYFVSNALDDVRQYIIDNDIKNVLYADFIEESAETSIRIVRDGFKGWTHGKFFEREFWNKHNIHYDDVRYCEDINLSTKIDCILCTERLKLNGYKKPVYVWNRRSDSLANVKYFVDSMPDYINATAGVIIDYVEKYKNDPELFMLFNVKFIASLLNIYFCFQTSFLNNNKKVLLNAISIFEPYFTRFKKVTKFTVTDIIYYINTDLMNLYHQTRQDNYNQVPFVEQISFQDWLLAYFD